MATIKSVLRNAKNDKGERAIFIRVSTTDGESYKATGFKVIDLPTHWDKANGRVLIHDNNIKKDYINAQLKEKEAELELKLFELQTSKVKIKSNDILNKKAVNAKDLIAFFEEWLDNLGPARYYGTGKRKDTILNKLKEFAPRLPVDQITTEWIESYNRELEIKHGNESGTRKANLKGIREIYNLMPETRNLPNPWKWFKMPSENSALVYLIEKQLDKIEKVEYAATLKKFRFQQMFLFSCNNCGLRVSDLVLMEWDFFKEGKEETDIVFLEKKGGFVKQTSIPLLSKGKEILDRLDKNTKYVFNMVPAGLNLEDPQTRETFLSSITTEYNSFLKELAFAAGIGINLTSHVARHTFATIALKNGLSLSYIARLLGHTSTRETEKYAKLIAMEVHAKTREVMNKK